MGDKNEQILIEERLLHMKNFYYKTEELIDSLPDTIPHKTKKMLKEKILGDEELKELMEGIDSHRAPRIFLIGRTGVGKSSLINALCDSYIAGVSDTKSYTKNASIYRYKSEDRTMLEIMDTRGIEESESLDDRLTAEQELIENIDRFSPDIAILMLNCTHRDGVDSDVNFLKKIAKNYYDKNGIQLPIVVVINKCDEMAPSRLKTPDEYPIKKIDKINEVVEYYQGIIQNNHLMIENIIPVSSLIDWQTQEGVELAANEIEELSPEEIKNLEIAFDGRYRIEELKEMLEQAITDVDAQMGFRMAIRLNHVVTKVSNQIIGIFSGIASTVALTPIPISDIYVLVLLQSVMVALIASLSGRDISLDTAKEFIYSLGGIAGAGYTFRLVAQQATKLLNGIFPSSGSLISSVIASTGTTAMGKAAVAYYIEGKSTEDTKRLFEKLKKDTRA